ncbi:MAG: GTP-binding protein [Candidatus Hodarchaeales archaeon]|jgi:small GTP-binding protein
MSTNLKVNLIGPGGTGKTKLLVTAGQMILKHGWPVENMIMWSEEMVSTIGGHFVNFGPLKIDTTSDIEAHSFSIWDLAGQIRYADVRKVYLEGTNGILAVVDLSRAQSLEILIEEMLKQEVRAVCEENVPICLVGNKMDLRDEIMDKKRELASLIQDHLDDILSHEEIQENVTIKIGPHKGKQNVKITKLTIGDRSALKAADAELILFNLLKEHYTGNSFTQMNLKLLSRQFWVTMANMFFKDTLTHEAPFEFLEQSNLGAPLFKEYLKNPDILVPLDWSKEEIRQMIQDSLLSMNELNKTANELVTSGFNIRGTLEVSVAQKMNTLESLTFVMNETIDFYKTKEKTMETEETVFKSENDEK